MPAPDGYLAAQRGVCAGCGHDGAAGCASAPECLAESGETFIQLACMAGECCRVDECSYAGEEACISPGPPSDFPQPMYCARQVDGCGHTFLGWMYMDAVRCEASTLVDPETRRCCGI